MADDFCLEENPGAACLTTHARTAGLDGAAEPSRVSGDSLDEQLLGPF